MHRVAHTQRVLSQIVSRPAARLALLLGLWLASLAIYYLAFCRPYALGTYLSTPKLSTGVIAGRQAAPAALFIFSVITLFALYAAAYRLCRGWRSPGVGMTIGVCGLLSALLLIQVYPIGANDLFGYITAGELLAHYDLNPMVYPASHVPNLPFAEYNAYAHIPPNYGPVWTWIEGLVVWIAGKPDLLRLTLGFKAVAVLGFGAACLVLGPVLRRRVPDELNAGLVVLAWNPLVLFEVAVNGHNDIWIGLLLLCAVLLWETGHLLWLLVPLALVPLIKLPAGAVLPLFFVAAWRLQPAGPRRLRFLLTGGATVVAVVAVSYLSLPEGIKGLANLGGRTDLFTHSLPAVIKLGLQLITEERMAALLAGGATALAFGGYALWQLRNAWQTPQEAVRLAFNVLLFLLLVCISWFQPWYLLWIVPLAAVYPRRDAPFQAGLFALCASWSYVVFGFVWFWIGRFSSWGNGLGIELMATINTFALSWEYALLSGLRRDKVTRPAQTHSRK